MPTGKIARGQMFRDIAVTGEIWVGDNGKRHDFSNIQIFQLEYSQPMTFAIESDGKTVYLKMPWEEALLLAKAILQANKIADV